MENLICLKYCNLWLCKLQLLQSWILHAWWTDIWCIILLSRKKTFVMYRMLTEISLPECIRCWNCIYTNKTFFSKPYAPSLVKASWDWKDQGNRNVHETLYSFSMYKQLVPWPSSLWSVQSFVLGNKCVQHQKKKKKMLCACAALSSMCVYIVTKQSFHFSFHSAEMCSYIKIKYFASECRFYTEHECGLTTVV